MAGPVVLERQEIIGAIRRIAQANGGTPPGEKRFKTETGTGRAAWLRYWVRWTEAVREAGYEPNKPLARLSDDHLLSRLAALTRELGHFPLSNELQFTAINDPDFPGKSTYGRLGRKAQLAALLADWCRENSGWDDVLALSEPVAAQEPGSAADADSDPNAGYVYMMKFRDHYKIGRSIAPESRLRKIKGYLPGPVVPVHQISTDDPAGIEKYWHQRFAHRRENGEWFRLAPADVAAFCRRESM